MRAVLVLALVAAAVVGAAAFDVDANESALMDENMSADEFDAAPFTPAAAEHDEVEADDEAGIASDEEVMSGADEEVDAADELEGNTEFAGASLLEASAEAETEEERVKRIKARKAKKVVRAPAPLKSKPFKFHSERIVADSTKPEDPELAKLDLALAAVKEDILSTNKQITDERKWVIAVAKIIASYNSKMKRVEAHIIALRKEMKSLYRKKKQIENLKLQRALEAKLKEARDELATLTGSLKHVAVKRGELNKSGSDLRATIAGIQAQLAKLRGQRLTKKKAKKSKKSAKKGKKAARRGRGRRGAKAAPRSRRCGKGKRYSRRQRKCVKRVARRV